MFDKQIMKCYASDATKTVSIQIQSSEMENELFSDSLLVGSGSSEYRKMQFQKHF